MEQMREIIDIRTVERAVWALAATFPVACLLVGAVLVAAKRGTQTTMLKAVLLAALGPLLLGLWLLYSHLVRYDPRSGYFGLDKLWVLAANVGVFVVVGAGYGYVAGRVWRPRSTPAMEAEGGSAANEPLGSKPAS
jgi:hypothetical protein